MNLNLGFVDTSGSGALIDPFLVGSAVCSATGTFSGSYGCSDYISFIASCYAYSRGSVRLKIKREYNPTSGLPYAYS